MKKGEKEKELADKAAAEAKKKEQEAPGSSFLGLFRRTSDKNEDQGSIEFSLAGLFKIMCCVAAKPDTEKAQLLLISASLSELNKRLDGIERLPFNSLLIKTFNY